MTHADGARGAAVSAKRLTPAMWRLLRHLAGGGAPTMYDGVATVGCVGMRRTERTFAALADRGLIDWSGAISDVTITDAGRAALRAKEASRGK